MKPTKGNVIVRGNVAPLIELGAGFDYDLTAGENIYLNGAILGYSKEQMNEYYDDIVEFSELKDFMNIPVKNFSSGMISRLAFAIATIGQPDILIVDEVLSVGDFHFQTKREARIRKMKELPFCLCLTVLTRFRALFQGGLAGKGQTENDGRCYGSRRNLQTIISRWKI